MQQQTGRRVLALVAALALGTAGSALAQDTTETGQARFDTTEAGAGAIDTTGADTSVLNRDTSAVNDTSAAGDTSDTSGVQNPPGYRGMERDTTLFPDKGGPPATPEEAAGQTTGTYGDSANAEQNPPGYRGMERPVGGDSAAAGGDTTGSDITGTDTTGSDTTTGDAYREERPAAADSAHSHSPDSTQ